MFAIFWTPKFGEKMFDVRDSKCSMTLATSLTLKYSEYTPRFLTDPYSKLGNWRLSI